jgi:methyl-accepting chemotaxis protein
MDLTGLKIKKNIIMVLLPVLLIGTVALGYYNYSTAKQRTLDQLNKTMLDLLSSASLNFDAELLSKINSPKDGDSEVYKGINQTISKLETAWGENDFSIIILRKDGDKFLIVADDKQGKNINQTFSSIPLMDEALNTNNAQISQLDTQNGTMQYGFAALLNQNSNPKYLMIIGRAIHNQMPGVLSTFSGPVLLLLILIIILYILVNRESNELNKGIEIIIHNIDLLIQNKSIFVNKHKYLEEINNALSDLESKIMGAKVTGMEKDKIQKQITELLKIVSSAANGDFTVSANVTADTLGALADSFNLMVSDLSDLVKDTKNAADQVATSTQAILKNINTMAKGAEDQASQTETISNFAKEMAKILNDTNQSAMRTAEAAHQAKNVADRGSEIISKSILGMHHIKDSVRDATRQVRLLADHSARIGEISDFIGEIASRTNLLALNASIEAARAGSDDDGFSVVADEIRSLAERSSKSADEISQLISDVQSGIEKTMKAMETGSKEVAEGTSLVDKAGEALKEILGSVEISTNSVVQISDATQKQTKYSEEIVTTLEHIAGIAKETAEEAKQSKNASEQLEHLSKNLNKTVAKFRLAQ